jgi:alpha/beta superfamily hydrolase
MPGHATVRAVPDPSRTDVAVPDPAWAGAVVLHPHPAYGGDRRNVVVDAVWRALPPAGVAAVRFDFDGDDLAAGAADATEALDLLPAGVPAALVGYSFGALVACQVVDPRVAGWALVAPPFGRMLPGADVPAGGDPRPKLVLAPSHDQFCPPEAARQEVGPWRATTVEAVTSADHFLAGATGFVADRVVQWLREITSRNWV